MKTLITPGQVIQFAFADAGYIPSESITAADIAAAEQRYIVPIVGRKLHAQLLEGTHADFTSEYLAAPLALYTRVLIQPLLDIRTTHGGTIAPQASAFQPASDEAVQRMRQALRTKARILTRCAAEHLAQNTARYPGYDPDDNVLTHCSIEGGIVRMK